MGKIDVREWEKTETSYTSIEEETLGLASEQSINYGKQL
jgi:hypothetical protein